MTLILAGIQMIRDNAPSEKFGWTNKERLYKIIRDNRKSGVILLSGDVHFAARYQTPCESLTGYTIPEYTSSGMTHILSTMIKGLGKILETIIEI